MPKRPCQRVCVQVFGCYMPKQCKKLHLDAYHFKLNLLHVKNFLTFEGGISTGDSLGGASNNIPCIICQNSKNFMLLIMITSYADFNASF